MEMENAENTMPFICSPIPIHTHACIHVSICTLCVSVISRIRLYICNNPANVTAIPLLCFWCILSRACKNTHTSTWIQAERERERAGAFNLFPRSMAVALACSPNFLRISHLSTYRYILCYIHIYFEHKILFFFLLFLSLIRLLLFFRALLFAHFRKIFNYKATIIYRIQLHSTTTSRSSKQVQT